MVAPSEILQSRSCFVFLHFRANLLIIEKVAFRFFLFKCFCPNRMEFFQRKIVEIIFKLPNFGFLHLPDSFFRERILVSRVLNMRFPGVIKELFSTREKLRQKLLQDLIKLNINPRRNLTC